MEFKDLIFKPFKLRCPHCIKYNEVTFEDLQFNEEITCSTCGKIFTPNIDANVLLNLIRQVENQPSPFPAAKKKED